MKIAIVGSRSFNDFDFIEQQVTSRLPVDMITDVISGGAKGVDKCAELFAKKHNLNLIVFKPDWSLGRGAGMIRNKQIVTEADIVFAFWNGESRGTKNSIETARKLGKTVHVIYFDHAPAFKEENQFQKWK